MLAIPAGAISAPAAAAAGWPALREELQLHAAGANPDGSPAWHIADPVRNHFVRIGWLEFEMLQRWGLSDARAIAAAIRAETTLAAEPYNVEAFVLFLREQSLLRQVEPRASLHRFGWNWLLHNYLFMRIPLVRPAHALGHTQGIGRRSRVDDRSTVLGDWLGRVLLDRASAVFTPYVRDAHSVGTPG